MKKKLKYSEKVLCFKRRKIFNFLQILLLHEMAFMTAYFSVFPQL